MIERLVPLLQANLGYQALTKQIIFFVQSNIVPIGDEILPLVREMTMLCAKNLAYESLEDTLVILNFTFSACKMQAQQLASESF